MPTHSRQYRSEIPALPDELYAWHDRDGAFERLTPPWAQTSIVASSGTMKPGDRKKLRVTMGPMHVNWTIEHEAIDGRGFADVQRSGPFASWRHEHRFRDTEIDTCSLEDSLTYALPADRLASGIVGARIDDRLDRVFGFRHIRTAQDLSRHRSFRDGPLRIAVTGATGLVGRNLIAFLKTGGHAVLPIVRRSIGDPHEIRWDPAAGSIDAAALEGCDAVIHLAGESIANGRWTAARKRAILSSRIDGTRLLANSLATLKHPPDVFVSASAVGFYGNRGDEILAETASRGSGFLADVCEAWEAAAAPAAAAGIRVVHPRLGVVVAGEGGMLPKLLPLFRLGIAGRIASGNQYMSWIGIDDLLGLLLAIVQDARFRGPVNAVSPQPVTNKEFTRLLASILHRPARIPLPAPAIRLTVGEMADALLLASQRAIPAKLEDARFPFFFAHIEDALRFELGAIDNAFRARMLLKLDTNTRVGLEHQ